MITKQMLKINKHHTKYIVLIKRLCLLLAFAIALSALNIYAGTVHAVGGTVTYSEGGSPSSVTFTAYITSRPEEILTESSAGCSYAGGSYWVQCSNFPTPWNAGDVFHIDLADGLGSNISAEVALTNNPADQLNLVISGSQPVISVLHINEFCASNNNIIADEHGEYDDWIEIYNATNEPVNIGGLFMTDSLDDPTKYMIPSDCPDSTTIPAYGHIILWADKQIEQGILHLNFRLERNGEQLGLFDTTGNEYIDSLTYGEQYSNSSISRYPDGTDRWISPPPTPGNLNLLPSVEGLYINEFSTSNSLIATDEHGDYDDWIEIYNSTDEPIDLGGLFITDSLGYPDKQRIPSTYPDSTTVPAHGYLVLWADNQEEQGVLHIGFRLGRDGEQIGLAGYNGIEYIDSLTYGEQYSNSSLSRYPDGSDHWICVPSTFGNTNTLSAITGLFINEFCASNMCILSDKYGAYDDWIEIYNSTEEPVDIGGMFITDSLGDPFMHRIPTICPDSTTIPPYGYLVLWADNEEDQGILHLGFKLGRDGEQIGLTGYDGTAYIDSLTYGDQYSNSSMSRYPDGNIKWMFGPSTPASNNIMYQTEGIYINEIMPNNDNIIADEHGEYDDWIEIYNATDGPVDIGGLFITDSLGDPVKCRIPTTFPDSTTIPANGYLLLWADNQEEQGILHLDFKLSKAGDAVGLTVLQSDLVVFIDSVSYQFDVSKNQSYGKIPDGTGQWIVLNSPTPRMVNIISSITNSYIENGKIHQNLPNPFINETTIEYNLPEHIQNAMIIIYDISGIKIKSIPILMKGYGHIVIQRSELKPGIYFYTLIADGQVIDTKRMILSE